MNYGLYLSASGALTSMYRMDVAANNLANVSTVGFRADHTAVQQRDTVRAEDGLGGVVGGRALLERLGGGVRMGPTVVDRSQGQALPSDNPLDIAIVGDGFLVVRAADGEGPGGNGAEGGSGGRVRLSRDGRLAFDSRGRLIQSSSGAAVLDESGREIVVVGGGAGGPRGGGGQAIRIDGDGTVSLVNGAQGGGGGVIGRVFVATPREGAGDGVRLEKVGNGGIRIIAGDREGGMESLRRADARVRQNAIEESTADPINAMMRVMEAERSVGSNIRMIQTQDELLGRLIQGVGRVA